MDINQVLEKLQFRFAKTMPENPHWYTVKTDELKEEYEYLFNYIWEHGCDEYWNGRKYRYLVIGDYKYWPMTKCIGDSRIINRKSVE